MSSTIYSEQLKAVEQARIQKTRPNKFRRILPVSGGYPAWVTTIETSVIAMQGARPVLLGNGVAKNLPRANIDKTRATIGVLKFGYSYGYTDDEVIKCQREQIELPSTLAVGNSQLVESFLDEIAAGYYLTGTGWGHTAGSASDQYPALGLQGLLNHASVTILTASAKASGGTAWTSATYEEIKRDVSYAIGAVYDDTLENREANLIVLPPARYRLLVESKHPVSERSVLRSLQEDFPGLRFEQWQKTATADAAGTGPRMLVGATGEDVARMVLPRELTDEAPMRVPFGWEIPQQFSTAGVLIEDPTALKYVDGI
jgi:hypothetical protein